MTTVTVNEEIIEVTQEIVETITVEVAEQGPPGVSADHSGLLNLDADDHLHYHTDARGDARYSLLAHDHSGAYEPADADLQAHLASTSNPHSVTAAQVGADATGTAAGLIASHEAAVNPHPGYLTPAEGDAAYSAIAHNHSGVYEAAGAVSTHAALTTTHGISTFGASLVDDVDAGTARTTLGLGTAATTASTDYATASHNHSASAITSGTIDTARLGSGAASASTYLRGDSTWASASGGVAADTHAATEKTTPVDADELPLVDSAASWVLKKLTWANVKATLAGVFPLLAGKSGGQTLIGGTGVTDKLLIKGTTANATVTAVAFEVDVGNNGALTALTIANNGQLTIQGDATTDLPTYGSELLTSAGWTVNTGWTESPDDTFAHSSGTGTLTHSATITNGYKYQISWTIAGRTTGSITIAVGGQSLASQTATGTWGPTATDTSAFTITPTTTFNGTVSLVSLKQISSPSTPAMLWKNSAGTAVGAYRVHNVNSNVFLGANAGRYCTTGTQNLALGYNAQSLMTTATGCIAIGGYSQESLTTGNYNCSLGIYSQIAVVSGSYNTAIGTSSQRALTSGTRNCSFGSDTLRGLTTGNYNVAFGDIAGRYHADGSTALTDPEYSVYIGANARGKDNSDDNSVVIGGNTPIGLGANTTVIGTSATTLTRLFGNLGLGVDSPSASIHTIKTTEQLRLGYDATYYASFTVSSAGNLTIDTVGNTIYTPDTIENTTSGAGIVLKSPDGTRYRLTVANGGTLSISAA